MKTRAYRVVLVPFPLTPLAVFGAFLYHAAGLISTQTVFCYHFRPNCEIGSGLDCRNILWLIGPNLVKQLKPIIARITEFDHNYLVKLLAFLGGVNAKPRHPANVLCYALSTALSTPGEVLNWAIIYFGNIASRRIPLDSADLPQMPKPPVPGGGQIFPDSYFYATLPVFKSAHPDDREVVDYQPVELRESRIASLIDQHLGVVVGGPPSSGKSTMVASLVNEMHNVIKSLKSRGHSWSNFDLSVTALNLDKGTPTVGAISESRGKNRRALSRKKRRWTVGLALEAVKELVEAKQEFNLVIGDLPGKIDGKTEIICAGADAGIILTHDWSLKPEWQSLYNRTGVVKVCQARTRTADEGLASMVRRFDRNTELAGRISGLDRTICSWDPFITFLARALLFDLLPGLIDKRRKAVERICPP